MKGIIHFIFFLKVCYKFKEKILNPVDFMVQVINIFKG
jgi:hypothetical protein